MVKPKLVRITKLIHDNPNAQKRARYHFVEHKTAAEENLPDRFELFILDEGQQKIEIREETSMYQKKTAFPLFTRPCILTFHTEVPNTTVFTFNKEDHTLGNLISQRLLKYNDVTFSAYKVPHPLFATFELRVTTDGSITPKDAVVRCCKDVVNELSKVSLSFQGEWLNQKIIEEGQRDAEVRDQGNY